MRSSYYKAVTLFCRGSQEKVIQDIEVKLHAIILAKTSRPESLRKRKIMEEITHQIHFSINNYHFEEDLLDYLISLDVFVAQYD
jgi:hypothetical protein